MGQIKLFLYRNEVERERPIGNEEVDEYFWSFFVSLVFDTSEFQSCSSVTEKLLRVAQRWMKAFEGRPPIPVSFVLIELINQ